MPFTKRIRVIEFASEVGTTPARVLRACKKLGLPVAAPESVLNPRECELLAGELSSERSTPHRAASRPTSARPSPGPSRRPASKVGRERWTSVEEQFARGDVVSGRVSEVVKGGVMVDLGVRAFLPASLVDTEWVDDLASLVGTTIQTRIIECDRSRSNVVLSRKVVIEEQRRRRAAELRASLQPGQTREATVEQIKHNGAVVDLGGITTWVPYSELALPEDASATDHLSTGERVAVTVCDVLADDVVVTLRKEERDDADDHIAKFLSGLPQDPGSRGLHAADGIVCLDMTGVSWPEASEAICRAIEEVRLHGLSELLVKTSSTGRRELRERLRTSGLAGVDARRSRQRADGFVLRLVSGERRRWQG